MTSPSPLPFLFWTMISTLVSSLIQEARCLSPSVTPIIIRSIARWADPSLLIWSLLLSDGRTGTSSTPTSWYLTATDSTHLTSAMMPPVSTPPHPELVCRQWVCFSSRRPDSKLPARSSNDPWRNLLTFELTGFITHILLWELDRTKLHSLNLELLL